MSAKYTFWAWDQEITKAPLKLALLQLADNANDEGVSWYSVPRMAKKCGMSERALQGHIITLTEMGLLRITDRPGTSRVYALQYQEVTLIVDPRRICATPPQNLRHTPAESADKPNKEPNNESNIKKKGKSDDFVLPENLNKEAWQLWIDYRKASGFKAYRNNALSAGRVINSLIEMSGGDMKVQMQIVDISMRNGWKGLFPLKPGVQKRGIMQISQPSNEIPDGFQ